MRWSSTCEDWHESEPGPLPVASRQEVCHANRHPEHCCGPVRRRARLRPQQQQKQQGGPLAPSGAAGNGSITELMKARGLTEADVTAALKTYTPTGGRDEYLLFASGGHSGQVIVIGIPSMRILKYIAVFTPDLATVGTKPR